MTDEEIWRNLALQFDAHRMRALQLLRAALDGGLQNRKEVEQFLASAPESGDDISDALIAAGVKAGLEMAAKSAFRACRASDAGYIDENARLLQRAENEMRLEVAKAIRATSPEDIAETVARVKGETG